MPEFGNLAFHQAKSLFTKFLMGIEGENDWHSWATWFQVFQCYGPKHQRRVGEALQGSSLRKLSVARILVEVVQGTS